MEPIIIINAKTYPESTGTNAVKMAKACDEVAYCYDADIGLALQPFDILPAQEATRRIKIFSQHIDVGTPGRNTGFVLGENIRAIGVTHTILNHSEHQLKPKQLEEAIKECKRLKITTVVCANTPAKAKKIALLKPDFIAVEPPSLIGGDISVSSAKPGIIKRAKKAVGNIPLLVGAGIKNGTDVRVALELGAVGVLVASGVVKARDPRVVLRDFLVNGEIK